MKDVDILIFGDSITYGLFDNELGGWVNRLRLNLENKSDNRKYYVLNMGIPGQSTEKVLERFDFECKSRFDVEDRIKIIFAVGTKDSQKINNKNRVDIERFKNNILNLIFQAKKYSDDIYFIGLTKVDEDKKKNYFNDEIIRFDNALENICAEEQIKYIKMYDLLTIDDFVDGIHPNSKAHKKLCDHIMENIFDSIRNENI